MFKRLNKSGKLPITKVAALILALTAGFILIFIIFLNDDGGVQKGNQAMENTMDKVTRLSRGNTEVNRLDIPVTKGFLSTWQNLISDITTYRERIANESDEKKQSYCVLPLSTTYLSADNRIELLDADKDLVVKLTYRDDASQTASEKFEAVTIDNLQVRLGILGENPLDPNYFSAITLQDQESIDLGSGLGLGPEGTFEFEPDNFLDKVWDLFGTNINEEITYLLMPLFIYSYDDNNNLIYNARGSMEGIAKHPKRADLGDIMRHSINDKPPLLLLLNYDTLVVVALEDGYDFYLHRLNLMEHFEQSGIDGTNDGYPFCKTEDNILLAPRDDKKCSCDVAKNPAMCTSLQVSNCGMSCEWIESSNTCEVADTSLSNVRQVFKETFTEALTNFKSNHRECYTAYSVALQTPSDEELSTLVEGLSIDFKENAIFYEKNKRDIDSMIPYSVSDTITETDKEAQLFTFQNKETEVTFDDIKKGELRIADVRNAYLKKNDELFYQLVIKQGKDNLVWETQANLKKESDPIFCTQDDIYKTGYVDRKDKCSDVDSMQACMLHEELGERCHWFKRNGFSLTRTGCKADTSKNFAKTPKYTDLPNEVIRAVAEVTDFLANTKEGCYAESPITSNVLELDNKKYSIYLENIGDDVGVFVQVEGKHTVTFLDKIVNGVTLAEGLRPIEGSKNPWEDGVYAFNGHEMNEGFTYLFRNVNGKRVVFISETNSITEDDLSDIAVC